MSNVRLEAVIKLLISNSCNYNCAISSCRGGEAKKKGRKQQFSARGLEGAKKKSEGSRGGKNYNTIESFQSNFSPEKAEGKWGKSRALGARRGEKKREQIMLYIMCRTRGGGGWKTKHKN
jgi:hypothetical protein